MPRRPLASAPAAGALLALLGGAVHLVAAPPAARAQDAPGSAPTTTDRAPPSVQAGPPPPAAPGPRGGRVVLALVVDAEGHTREAAVERVELDPPGPGAPEADPVLREALAALARRHVEALRFAPAMVDGAPVTARVRFEVDLRPAESRLRGASADRRAPPAAPSGEGGGGPAAALDGGPGGAHARTAAEEGADVAPATAVDGGAAEGGDAGGGGGFGAEAATTAPVAERPPVAVSDFDVEVGELRRVPRTGAQSLLTLVPGVLLTTHATEGHALGMFLRGFDAGEGEDLEVLVDGMPINEVSNAHGHGYVDVLAVIPQVVEGLHLVMGPFDPVQGDFAIAGTAEYRLGLAERGLHASLGLGRFGELRAAGWWGPHQASDGTFVAFAYNEGDGFGPNRSFRNGSAMARYEHADGPLRLSVLALAGTGSWLSAGVLRADDVDRRRVPDCPADVDSQFFCLYDPGQGGSTSQAGLVGRLRYARGDELFELTTFGRFRSLRIQENFTGFVTDPRTDGGPQRGDNLDQRYDGATVGARTRYRIARTWLGFAQRFEAGVQLRYDDFDTVADRRRDADLVPYRTEFDRAVRETLVGGYARVDLRLHERLSITGGARADFFGFDVVDRNFPVVDEDGERLRRAAFSASGLAFSPRGTVTVGLVDGLDLLVAAGLGARSSDAAALSEAELAPFARILAFEAGLAFDDRPFEDPAWRLEARTSAFTTRVSQDLVFDPTAGRNSLLGPSTRTGALGQVRLRWNTTLDVLGSVTYTRAHLQPEDAGDLELFAGPRLPFIPSWVGRLDAALTFPVRLAAERLMLGGALGVQYVGPRPLPLEQVADPFTLVDVAVSARWRVLELAVALQNLFDVRYRSVELNYVSNFRDPELPPSMMAARHFSAGPPRTFLVTLAVHVDTAP